MDNELGYSKVLYVSQEIEPYVPATRLSCFGRLLPQGIQERGVEVRTFMPRYGCINERRNQLHEVIRLSGMNIPINDTDHPLIIKVATLQPTRMQVYFIDNDDYFQRHAASGLETETQAADNDERTIFFVRGTVETVKKLRWEPQIVHCTGWVTALTPLYLRHVYADDPAFRSSKIVYSIFENDLDGALDPQIVNKLRAEGFTDDDIRPLVDGPATYRSLCKVAIDHADALVVSTSDVDPDLLDYARRSGKPMLDYTGEDIAVEAYAQFYSKL